MPLIYFVLIWKLDNKFVAEASVYHKNYAMTAKDLAPYRARSSAAIVLIM